MATILSKIEDYIGTFGDTTALNNWLNAGAQFILMRLPKEAIMHLATPLEVPSGGVSVYGKRVLEVHSNYYPSKEYPTSMKGRLISSSSIYKATETSPAHIYDNAKLYIYPSGGHAIVVGLPTAINCAADNDDTSFDVIPQDLKEAVILYACIQGQIYKLNALDAGISAIALSLPTAPTTVSLPSFTFTEVTPTSIGITTIDDFGAVPIYVATLPSVPTFALTSIGTAPTALSAPSFNYTDVVASKVEIASLIDLATQFSTLTTYIGTDEDFELAQAKINEIQTRIQEYVNESTFAMQEAIKNADAENNVALKNELENLSAQVQEYNAKVQRYGAELNKYQIDINTKTQEYQLTLEAWRTNVQSLLSDGLNRFQAEAMSYQANVQKAMQQAQLDQQRLLQIASNTDSISMANEARELERQVAEYRATLDKFMSDLQSYSAQVNKEVSRVNILLAQYNARYVQMQSLLKDLQNEFNRFLNYYGIK